MVLLRNPYKTHLNESREKNKERNLLFRIRKAKPTVKWQKYFKPHTKLKTN